MSAVDSDKSSGPVDADKATSDSTTSKYFTSIKTTSSVSQPAKRLRPQSEESNTSAEEMTLILTELGEIREGMLKKDDVKTLVTDIVKGLLAEHKTEINNQICEIEQKHKDEVYQLKEQIAGLNLDNETLREKLAERAKEMREMKEVVKVTRDAAVDAQTRSNYNEQYSRKTNIKVYGVNEGAKEKTSEIVINILKSVAKVDLKEDEIVAVHRIPGKGDDRPILLKVKNSEIKARIMRARPVFKKSKKGYRLADDVTQLNSKLIDTLNKHPLIDQAWYFNGSVYGKPVDCETRIRFDLCDSDDVSIARKVKSAASAKAAKK